MLFTTCGRKVGFLIAKKSYDRPFIGLWAKVFNSIPVIRKQDVTKDGQGKLYMTDDKLKLHGIETKFSEYSAGFTIVLPKDGGSFIVDKILNDVELVLKKPIDDDKDVTMLSLKGDDGKPLGTEFKFTPIIDQSNMFSAVVQRLSKGMAVGTLFNRHLPRRRLPRPSRDAPPPSRSCHNGPRNSLKISRL